MAGGKVFPAHAGMSPRELAKKVEKISFPRTRGDEPELAAATYTPTTFSPHTRG